MRAILIVAALPLAGCAAFMNLDQPRPEQILERALTAYEQEDFQSAYMDLSWTYDNHWRRPVGEKALLALAAVELDPRNFSRRLLVGAEMAGWHGQLPTADPWATPVTQTLAGLARELDAAQRRIAMLEAELGATVSEREQAVRERDQAQRDRLNALTEANRARAAAASAREEAIQAREQARRAEATRAAGAPAASTTERDRLARQVESLRNSLEEREAELTRVRQTLGQP